MGFVHEIQASLIDEKSDLSAVLLKVRLLAAKLRNHPLEEWVKYESEGYPDNVEVPAYRSIGVAWTGVFTDIVRKITSPIPPYLIKEFAGEGWNRRDMRQSMAGIVELAGASKDGSLHLSGSNLVLLLQGKVYEGMACHAVSGTMAASALADILSAVRNRVLDLTIELEKSVPGAGDISLINSPALNASAVTSVVNQVFHGDYTSISNTGAAANISVTINKGDSAALVSALVDAGLTKGDAEEFAIIVASERPESKEQPFGAKAKAWIGNNIKKAMDGTWKISLGVVTGVLTKAVLMYYGLT